MKNQTSLDNELAFKIVEILKGQTYFVAEKAIELAQSLIKMDSVVRDDYVPPITRECN